MSSENKSPHASDTRNLYAEVPQYSSLSLSFVSIHEKVLRN